jgi:mono/diheme cytochrome c family protein
LLRPLPVRITMKHLHNNKRAGLPATLALAALISLTACGVGELDAESQRALAISQGQTPQPGVTPAPSAAPTPAPSASTPPAASPSPSRTPSASPAPSAAPTASPAPSPSPAPTPAASAANGKQLFNSQRAGKTSCQTCHGDISGKSVGPNMDFTGKLSLAANNPSVISQAITTDKGGMGQLKNLYSAAELADMAAYIAGP